MFTLEERNVLFVFVIKMLLLLSRIFVPPVAFSAYITSRYTRLVISSRKLVFPLLSRLRPGVALQQPACHPVSEMSSCFIVSESRKAAVRDKPECRV